MIKRVEINKTNKNGKRGGIQFMAASDLNF